MEALSVTDEKTTKKITIKFDWFWLAFAVTAIAMMHYGYSCDSCGVSCVAPQTQSK